MLQFRLRTLMLVMLGSAFSCWAIFSPPQWLGLLTIWIIYSLLPAVNIAGIVFHRGNWQAFFIGMAPWSAIVAGWTYTAVLIWVPLNNPWSMLDTLLVTDESQKIVLAIPLTIAFANGLVAVGIRVWAVSLSRKAASSTSDDSR